MQAAVLNHFKEPLEIKQVEIPKPGSDDVLIKTIACGVCHTDLHFIRGDWEIFQQYLPRIPGHEGIGEVIELGSNANDYLKKGDIIGIPWVHETCLQCEYCLTDREEFCMKLVRSGVSVHGCFAEYVLMNAKFAVKLPQDMDPYTSAPLYCAGVTMYKALKSSRLKSGEWISIVGVGGLGSIGIQYAIAMDMKVLAVVAPDDKNSVKLAKELGVEDVYDGPADKHGEWIRNKVGGVQASFVTVPLTIAFEQAFESVKRCGRVIGVGMPKGNMSIPITRWVTSGIELIGSTLGSRHDLQEALDFAKLHRIECKVEKRNLEDINEIFDEMSNGKINGRIVIDFVTK